MNDAASVSNKMYLKDHHKRKCCLTDLLKTEIQFSGYHILFMCFLGIFKFHIISLII